MDFLKSKMNESKILFNEKCSVCNFEIKHYKQRSELNFGVVIYIGDNDENYVKDLTSSLESQFPSAFLDEKIVVLSPPENFYPNFTEEIRKIQESRKSRQKIDFFFRGKP